METRVADVRVDQNSGVTREVWVLSCRVQVEIRAGEVQVEIRAGEVRVEIRAADDVCQRIHSINVQPLCVNA